MAVTTNRRVNTPSGMREFRVPPNHKKMLGLVRSNEPIKAVFAELEASSDVFDRSSGAGASALAMKFASHILTGGVVDLASTRHLVGEVERSFKDNVVDLLDKFNVLGESKGRQAVGNSSSIADDMISYNANMAYKVNMDVDDGKIRRNMVRATSRGGGYGLTVVDMRDPQGAITISPMDMVESEARSELDVIIMHLANSNGITKGKVLGYKNPVDYVSAPIYTKKEQVKTSGLSDEARLALEDARIERESEREILFSNDKYKGKTPEEIANLKAIELQEAEIANAANDAFHDVFKYINEKIYKHAEDKSQEQLKKYGTTSVDEDGNRHPYAVKKSANHDGNVLLEDAVRVPRAGNYFFEKGYSSDGSHSSAKAYHETMTEIKDYMADKHPKADFNTFAALHLDSQEKMGYFKALTTTNPALASNENCAPDMLFPIVNMEGSLFGVQRVSDDNYNKKNPKKNLKGTQLTEEEVFMPIANGFTKDTEVVVIGEGKATVESTAIALFGADYKNIQNLAVIAAIDSNNLKKIAPKLNDLYEQQFGVKKDLHYVVAIDNDLKSIDPFGRHRSFRTRDDFEKDAVNERGAILTKVPANAGLGVYNHLSETPDFKASFITVPSKYNQHENPLNVQDKHLTARQDWPDINDAIVGYGLEKTREILAPQIKAAAFDVVSNNTADNTATVSVKMDSYNATATDFAIQAAFKELSPAQAETLNDTRQDAQILHLALKNKEFRDFVSDYVTEVEQSNPAHYKPFANLRESFVGADLATNMENSLSMKQRSDIIFMMAGVQLNSPEIGGSLQTLNAKVQDLANGPLGQKYPEHIGLMAHGVDRFMQVKNGADVFNATYEDFRQTNFAAIDILSSTYFDHAAKSFERSGLPGADEYAKRSANIKDNVYDTLRRRIDPEITALQIPRDNDPVAAKVEPLVATSSPEPQKVEPAKVDDSPSMDM